MLTESACNDNDNNNDDNDDNDNKSAAATQCTIGDRWCIAWLSE